MTFRDGVAYLQAGGGIVFDSDESDEYIETINKLYVCAAVDRLTPRRASNVRALAEAEDYHAALQADS